MTYIALLVTIWGVPLRERMDTPSDEFYAFMLICC